MSSSSSSNNQQLWDERHSIPLGICLCLAGGIAGSTCLIFFHKAAPRIMREPELPYEVKWFLFTTSFVLLNVVWSLLVLSPTKVSRVVDSSNARDISITSVFCFFWGAGLILLVEIVIRQGIGRGLSVLITLLVLMDAMAILIKELKQGFDVAIFFMILLALALAFSGLLCFGRSLWLTEDAKYKTAVLTVVAASNEKPLEVVEEMKGGALEEPTSQAPLDEARREPEGNSNRRPRRAHPRNAFDGITQHYSKRLAFELLLAGASAAKLVTLMQFAFTYSGDIITHTKEEFGMGPQDTMNLIWLMLFSFAGIWNLAYATFLLTRRGTWSQVFSCASPEEEVDAHSGPACCRTAGMLRPWLQSGVCALLFIAFPRCFGAASLEFGDSGEVASISLLMVMILYFGQLWSIFLGEWEGETRRPIILNALALVLVCLSVVVLICGGAFLF